MTTQRLPRISRCVSPRNPHFVAPSPVDREHPDPKDTFRWRKCPSSQTGTVAKRFCVRFSHTDTKDKKGAFFEGLPQTPQPPPVRRLRPPPPPFRKTEKTLEKLIFIEKYCLNCLNRPCASSAHWIRGADPQFVTTDTSSVEKCLLDPRGRVCT